MSSTLGVRPVKSRSRNSFTTAASSSASSESSAPAAPVASPIAAAMRRGSNGTSRPSRFLTFSTPAIATLALLQQGLQLLQELVDVLELPVHRSEPHVGHLIQLAQLAHDELTDELRRDLLVEHLVELRLDAVHDLLDAIHGDGPLLASLEHPREDLAAI